MALQDPNRDELIRNLRAQSPPRASEMHTQGISMDDIIVTPSTLPTLSDYDQQKEDARIWQAKLDAIDGGDLWRHAKQETWMFPSTGGKKAVPTLDEDGKLYYEDQRDERIDDYNDLIPDTWTKDPSWVMSWDEYRKLIAGVPVIAHNDILNAKSIAHAEAIRNHSIKRMQEIGMMHEKYGGARMFFTYLGTGLVDPVNIGLMVGGAGIYKKAADVYKYTRLARFARVGTLAATEGAVVVGLRAKDDPLLDEFHVGMAAVLAGVIGGGISAAFKTRVPDGKDLVLRKATFNEMPEVRKGSWEDVWDEPRPPIYFEPMLETSQTWGNMPGGGRILIAGDQAKNRVGILWEAPDGRAAFKIDQDGVISYWSPDYKISGTWDPKTGRATFNMETLELKPSLRANAFDLDGPGHPLRVEQEIEKVVKEFHKKFGSEAAQWDTNVRATKKPGAIDPTEQRIANIKKTLNEGKITEGKRRLLQEELAELEGAPRAPTPTKVKPMPDDFDIDEVSAVGGTKGTVYDSHGFGEIPAHAVETIESLVERAARAKFPEDLAAQEAYKVGLRYPLMKYWNNLTGREMLDHLTEYDLIRDAQKHGTYNRETGEFIPRREIAEMDPVAFAKLKRNQRKIVEREQAALLKEYRALEVAENAAYKQQLIDLGDGTNKMFLHRIVVGPDTSVDSPIGIVTKVLDDGSLEVNFGAFHKDPRTERVVGPAKRADRATRELEQQKKSQATIQKWSVEDFVSAAKGGKLQRATGKQIKGEEEALSGVELGLINKYPPSDIAHFYLRRAVGGDPSEVLSKLNEAQQKKLIDIAHQQLQDDLAELGPVGGPATRETDPGDPYRPVEEADVIRDPESIMHPERLQTHTVDDITPISPRVLSGEFLETDLKLTPSKLAPLSDAQKLRLFQANQDELTHPDRIALQENIASQQLVLKENTRVGKDLRGRIKGLQEEAKANPPGVFGPLSIVPPNRTLMDGATIWMTPDDFLAISTPKGWKPDPGKLEKLRKALIEREEPLRDAPSISLRNIDVEGTVGAHGHEGRHRALILKEMGEEYMPVTMTLRGTAHPFAPPTTSFSRELEDLAEMPARDAVQQPNFPREIKSEYTDDRIPFLLPDDPETRMVIQGKMYGPHRAADIQRKLDAAILQLELTDGARKSIQNKIKGLKNTLESLRRYRGKSYFDVEYDTSTYPRDTGLHRPHRISDMDEVGELYYHELEELSPSYLAGTKGVGIPESWEIKTLHGVEGTPKTSFRPEQSEASGTIISQIHLRSPVGQRDFGATAGESTVYPVTHSYTPVLNLGFGTLHYIELLKSAQKMRVAFRNDPGGTTAEVHAIYERLKKAGVPFKRRTAPGWREMEAEEIEAHRAEYGEEPRETMLRSTLEIKHYIGIDELQSLDLDKIARKVKAMNKSDLGYSPKQGVQEYKGAGPSGEPFTLEAYPRSDPSDVSPTPNWSGPKEYTLHIPGGSKFGYDLEATNLKDAKIEIKELLLDRVVRRESEALKTHWNTQAEREVLAEAARVDMEVFQIIAGRLHLEIEELGDLMAHVPKHLRLRRWQEVNSRIQGLLDDWRSEKIHPAASLDPTDIEIILPNGKVMSIDEIKKAPKRPKKVVAEELRTIREYEESIPKWQERITETNNRIREMKAVLKAQGERRPRREPGHVTELSEEDLALIKNELKRLQKRNRSDKAKLRKLEKDLADVERVAEEFEPFSRPKRGKPSERRHNIIYDQESDDFFFVRNKKTGTTRSVDDIMNEAEDAGAKVRASKARAENAENPGEPNTSAFDDTPHGIDEGIPDPNDAKSFNDTGWGAKLNTIKGMAFWSLKSKTQNLPFGIYRWISQRIVGGFVDELDEATLRGPFRKGGVKMPVETDSPWGRRGIEEGRDEMVKMRLAFFDEIQEEFQTWRKLNGKGFMSFWTNTAQDEFGEIIGRMKIDRTGKFINEIPEHSREVVMKAVKKAEKHFDGELAFLQQYGKGWEDIVSDPHYLPRFWDRAKIAMHRGKLGLAIDDKELAKVFQNGLLSANKQARAAAQELGEKGPRELSEGEAFKIGEKFLDSIGNNNFRLNLINDASHQKATALELAQILEKNFGLDPQEALDLAATFRVTEKKARHQMYRIRLDLDIETPVMSRGEIINVKLSDLIDHNVFTGARRYARHTSSKILVQQMIDDANAKLGKPDYFKNLDDLIELTVAHLKKEKITGEQLKRLTKYLDSLSRIARDQPFSESTEAAMGMQLARQIAYSMGHGATFGISALAEASAANWVQGVKGFMEGMPALRRMVGGVTKIDKAELKEFAASLGMGVRERIIPRMDLMGRIIEEGGSTSLGRQAVIRRFWMGATRMMTEASGLMKMTEWADHMALKRHMVHYGNMMIRGERPNDIRLTDMGLTKAEWDRIARQVKKLYKRQTSVEGVDTYQYDFSEWTDQGALDLFAQAMQAEIKSVSQRGSRADMPSWYFANPTAHEATKVALQYRGFGISSINNYVVRNLRASDARSLYVFAASVAGGSLAYIIKGMLSHEDTPEGRERFKERMSIASIARGAFLQSGFTAGLENLTLLSGPLLGMDVYGNYHRRGLTNSWVDQIRALSYGDDVVAMIQSFVQSGVMDSREFTQADYRRIQRVFGIMRHPLIAPFVKDLGNGLPTKSK